MPITLNGSAGITFPDSTLQTSGVPTASATSGAPVVSNGTIYTQNTAVTVAFGGTGATTLTGVLKGNGTSAFTAAVAGTDFVAPGGALGTPSSGNLASCTGYSASNLASGTLPAARLPVGTVLQVAQTVKSDAFTSTTKGSYVAVTGLSITITPSSSSNKVLVSANVTTGTLNNLSCYFHIYRNGTQITPNGVNTNLTPSTTYSAFASGDASNAGGSSTIPLEFLDSPATTSPVTYQIYAAVNSGAVLNLNVNPATRNGGGTAGGSSSITVMEISG